MQTIIRQIYRYEFLCGASCCPSPSQDIVHPERAHLRNVKRVVDNGIFAHSEKTRNKLHNPHVPNPDWWREKQRTERRYVEDAWIPADRYEGMGQIKVPKEKGGQPGSSDAASMLEKPPTPAEPVQWDDDNLEWLVPQSMHRVVLC